MPISEKIMSQVKNADATPPEKELMMQILQVEDKGSFRYQADYEALIKKFIDEHKETEA